MTSFIVDNGIESPANRGRFLGFRNPEGRLEGVALIGHTTLIEARSDEALKAFAFAAKTSETPLHIIMSSGDSADEFWRYYDSGAKEPRLRCTELLFEVNFPYLVPACEREIRPARPEELLEIAEAAGCNSLHGKRCRSDGKGPRRISQTRAAAELSRIEYSSSMRMASSFSRPTSSPKPLKLFTWKAYTSPRNFADAVSDLAAWRS